MMPTNYSHSPVVARYLVLYYPHKVEVDLSLLVLVHPRLQDRSAEWSHVQQPLNRSVIRILFRQRSTGKRLTCYGLRYTSLNIPTKKKVGSFSDPHWFQFTDPDPDFYLNADPNPDLGSKTNADPCGSGYLSDFAHKKLDFDMRNILYVGNIS